ncbi:MAG: PIG-L deacetylase family protein [Candidatus Hermodarchaeota archaeon]
MFFQAHPDDLELNCAHLLHYLALKSPITHEIRITSLTKGEFGLPGIEYDKYKGDYLASIRVKELYNAAAIHGIPPQNIDWLGYIDGFVDFNGKLIEDITLYLDEYQPDVIIAPEALYTWYYHKDHVNTGRAIYYVINNKLIENVPDLYYYSSLSPNYYFPIDPRNISLTEKLIACHKTQVWLLKSMKRMLKPVWVISGLKTQGWRYAEPYRRVFFDSKNKNKANFLVRGLIRIIASKAEIFDAQYPLEILKELGKA